MGVNRVMVVKSTRLTDISVQMLLVIWKQIHFSKRIVRTVMCSTISRRWAMLFVLVFTICTCSSVGTIRLP